MPSSAPGAKTEPRSPAEARRQTAMALGTLGGIIGGIMGLVLFAMGAFGLAIDADATRAEETAVMAATLALIVLSVVGAVGGSAARRAPGRGAGLLALAAAGGVVVFLLLGLAEIAGLSGDDSEGFLLDALWLIIGFWAVPALLFGTGAFLARGAVEPAPSST
ncbi:MAG: hypothetical protein HYU28_01290 [Actinobacteria bacterium]|nr:hypothetical protein [Actinomycetota bacterium]